MTYHEDLLTIKGCGREMNRRECDSSALNCDKASFPLSMEAGKMTSEIPMALESIIIHR